MPFLKMFLEEKGTLKELTADREAKLIAAIEVTAEPLLNTLLEILAGKVPKLKLTASQEARIAAAIGVIAIPFLKMFLEKEGVSLTAEQEAELATIIEGLAGLIGLIALPLLNAKLEQDERLKKMAVANALLQINNEQQLPSVEEGDSRKSESPLAQAASGRGVPKTAIESHQESAEWADEPTNTRTAEYSERIIELMALIMNMLERITNIDFEKLIERLGREIHDVFGSFEDHLFETHYAQRRFGSSPKR